MIKIILNGEQSELEKSVTLSDLLEIFSLSKKRVAIELNKEVVRKQDWGETIINNEDSIEVIHFVGGG